MPFAFLAFLGRKKVDKFIIELPLLFTVLVLLAVGIGFFNQANPYLIFLDIKPLMYFYIIFFFYVVITKIRHIELVLKLLKFSAVAMALAYLAVFAATMNPLVNVSSKEIKIKRARILDHAFFSLKKTMNPIPK